MRLLIHRRQEYRRDGGGLRIRLGSLLRCLRRPAWLLGAVNRLARTVLDRIFDCLTAWLAPFLCFTAEEAWLARTRGGDGASVHERLFPVLPPEWRDDALAAKWEIVRRLRRVVTGAIEVERAANRLGASLQAHPVICLLYTSRCV